MLSVVGFPLAPAHGLPLKFVLETQRKERAFLPSHSPCFDAATFVLQIGIMSWACSNTCAGSAGYSVCT